MFLLTYIWAFAIPQKTLSAKWFFLLMAAGVYLNETVLGVQGIASFSYTLIPYVNHILLGVAILIVVAMIGMNASFKETD